MYFGCFPVSESNGYNFSCHLPGELHGRRGALSYHFVFVSDSHGSNGKGNTLFLWSLKFLNINELERSKQIISAHSGATVLWIRSMSLEPHCPKSWQRSDRDHKNAGVISDSLLVPRHEPSAGVWLSTDCCPSPWPRCPIYKPGANFILACMSVGWKQDEGLITPFEPFGSSVSPA